MIFFSKNALPKVKVFFWFDLFFSRPAQNTSRKNPQNSVPFFPRARSQTQNKRPALVAGFSSLSLYPFPKRTAKEKQERNVGFVCVEKNRLHGSRAARRTQEPAFACFGFGFFLTRNAKQQQFFLLFGAKKNSGMDKAIKNIFLFIYQYVFFEPERLFICSWACFCFLIFLCIDF